LIDELFLQLIAVESVKLCVYIYKLRTKLRNIITFNTHRLHYLSFNIFLLL